MTDRRTDRRMNRRMNRRTDRRMNRRMNRRTNRRTDRRTNRRMSWRMGRKMNKRMNRCRRTDRNTDRGLEKQINGQREWNRERASGKADGQSDVKWDWESPYTIWCIGQVMKRYVSYQRPWPAEDKRRFRSFICFIWWLRLNGWLRWDLIRKIIECNVVVSILSRFFSHSRSFLKPDKRNQRKLFKTRCSKGEIRLCYLCLFLLKFVSDDRLCL